jgi:flagellar protein FlgJ
VTLATTPSQPASTLAFAGGTQSLDALRAKAGGDPRGAIKEAAKAFETMFMQELLKSMRASTMASGMLDNAGTKLGTEWLDAQFSQVASGRPGSLADMIEKQLDRQLGSIPGALATPLAAQVMAPPKASLQAVPANAVGAAGAANAANAANTAGRAASSGLPSGLTARTAATGSSELPPIRLPQQAAADFIQNHQAAAEAAEAATGIPAAFMVSQAALETGWGRHQIRHADGSPSHNLFGIKAGPGWKGAVAEVMTTEYVDGRPIKVKEAFRAYASPADSFADYARLIGTSPRYAKVVQQADDAHGFAQGLQQAGYATDPNYADKLSRVINTTLRLQRTVA